MRAAIYARYSSDLQRAASIEDQVRLCRERADRDGWDIVQVYSDAAISGAHAHNRPGLQQMIADAGARRFEIVICEALDRLSRRLSDVAALFDDLTHRDVKIVTLSEGEITDLHVGLKGTMNQAFLKDLAAKVRRGLRGKVEQGLAPGGRSYGYKVVRKFDEKGEPVRGLREIDPAEAAIVRRVFEEYVAGKSPLAIARDLNRDAVPAQRGGQWNASAIVGSRARRHGLLHNELYIGRLLFNRIGYRKDPRTGAREARINAGAAWISVDVPELRIVPQELWDQAQATRRRYSAQPLTAARRPKHLLSGLTRCGCCAGAYTIQKTNRLACATLHNKGTCDNHRTITVDELETRVLGGLRDRLLAPDVFKAVAAEARAYARRRRQRTAAGADSHARELADVRAKIGRLVALIEEEGAIANSKALGQRLRALERRQDELQAAARSATSAAADNVVDVLPNLPELYRRKVEQLTAALALPATRDQAKTILRSMIEKIVVQPGAGRGETILQLHGRIAEILAFAAGQRTANVLTLQRVGIGGAG